MELYGQALLEFFNGDAEATLFVCREDGVRERLPLNSAFRGSTDWAIDRVALAKCCGRVLDIGAGTGLHSLHLQERGLSVCAIDVSSQACDIMRRRGVCEVHCADVACFDAEPFDTALILGRTIGMVEDLSGLDRFLKRLHNLVNDGGQVLLNSLDVRCTENPVHLAYQAATREAGRYVGEVKWRFEYKEQRGPMLTWLYVDPETLIRHGQEHSWCVEILQQEDDGNYLARLTKEKEPQPADGGGLRRSSANRSNHGRCRPRNGVEMRITHTQTPVPRTGSFFDVLPLW
ncbi:MAG TPA: class I SAM-dependent methyltransferase [Candidatus Hydrogenedentes bacterium]|nr:class I SAM-dependent methyltransferase [Candidatus Hydrogenedentota bacterium]